MQVLSAAEKKGMNTVFALRSARSYRPERKSERVSLVERLLALPRVSTNKFLGIDARDALEDVLREGERLNRGNPWKGSTEQLDSLRSNLGTLKALGAIESVLSWLAYGVPARTYKEPRYVTFPIHGPPTSARKLWRGSL